MRVHTRENPLYLEAQSSILSHRKSNESHEKEYTRRQIEHYEREVTTACLHVLENVQKRRLEKITYEEDSWVFKTIRRCSERTVRIETSNSLEAEKI